MLILTTSIVLEGIAADVMPKMHVLSNGKAIFVHRCIEKYGYDYKVWHYC